MHVWLERSPLIPAHHGVERHRSLPLALLVCALAVFAGCGTIHGWASRDESERRAARLQELQLKVMRYADECTGGIADPIAAFKTQARTPEERLAAQNWSITQASATYAIASGANPTISALDMIVLATLSRMVLEEHWLPEYGERALALLEVHRHMEQQSWSLVDGVLTAEHRDQLQAIIVQWRAEHPKARSITQIRFANFAGIGGKHSNAPQSGSVFAFIGLDPLSNLDPAVRELEQTRQLAERAIYYLQRAPGLLDMQIERLSYQLSAMPEAQQTFTGIERIGLAAEAVGQLSSNAPAIIADERHALISELAATLRAEHDRMQGLLADVKDTLEAGAHTSESVTTAIAALDALVARVKPTDRPTSASSVPGRTFDITEYAATARDVALAAHAAQALLVQLEMSGAGVQRLKDATKQDLQDVIDRAFWRALALIGTLGMFVLLAALVFRRGQRVGGRHVV
jgi:hypothetical protein